MVNRKTTHVSVNLLFLFDSRPLGTLSGSRIGAGPLATTGKGFPMTKSTVAAKVHQPFDIH